MAWVATGCGESLTAAENTASGAAPRYLVASLPPCKNIAATEALSVPSELSRQSTPEDSDFEDTMSPFDPFLVSSPTGETELVWSPAWGSALQTTGGNLVQARTWNAETGWSNPVVVAKGGTYKRFFPTAISNSSSGLNVAWMEFPITPDGDDGTWILRGNERRDGHWSDALLLNDQAAKVGFAPPLLFETAEGKTGVVWRDERERHIVFSLSHGFFTAESYSKLFERSFDASLDAPATRISDEGKFGVAIPSVVKNPSHGDVEIVAFKFKRNEWGEAETSRKQGLRIYSRTSSGWQDQGWALPPEIRRRPPETISSIQTAATRAGALVIAYRAHPRERRPGARFDTELRLARRLKGGSADLKTLAEGVEEGHVRPSVLLEPAPGDALALGYQGVVLKYDEELKLWSSALHEPINPIYYLQIEGGECIRTAKIADRTIKGFFHMAVDLEGRTHFVWVEYDGENAIMKHRWLEPIPKPEGSAEE